MSFKVGQDDFVVDDDQMKLKHAVHLTNISSGRGKAGAFIGCSEMTFIVAFYEDHCEEVKKLVDGRVEVWKKKETTENY